MPIDAIATVIAAFVGLIGTIAAVLIQRRGTAADAATPVGVSRAAPTPQAVSPPQDRLDRILKAGKIACGVIKHPPLADFNYKHGTWLFDGLYVRLAQKVAEAASLELDFAAVDWADLPESFVTRDLDLVLSVFETRQRLAYADFTAAFHRIGVGGVALANTAKVQKVSDLHRDDVRVVVSRGEVGWECAVHDLHIPKRRLVIVDDPNLPDIVDYVRSGVADVAIIDAWSCHQCVAGDQQLRHVFADDNLYVCKNSIMIPKGEHRLEQWVEKQFLEARKSPAIARFETQIIAESNGLIRTFR